MRMLLADPALTRRTPGEEVARCVAGRTSAEVTVRLAVSLPTTFPLAEHRPRYTVRHLLKAAVVTDEPVRYVVEMPASGGPEVAGASYGSTPEAAFVAFLAEAKLADLSATVALPRGLTEDPALLAAYLDHRLVVRLCTVENEALLLGSVDGGIGGLLRLPHLRRRPAHGPLDGSLTAAAAEVEEMGGSCDGIVVHPVRYWQMVQSGLLARLGEAGVRVSRTRMIGKDEALLGDFRAAATLVEPGWSTVTVRHGGAGGVATASVRVGLAVHLSQHLLLLELS